MSDLARFRRHFPVLDGCVYLNSNSTGAFPAATQQVLQAYGAALASWRDEIWEGWIGDLRRYHDTLERFLGARAGTVTSDGNLSTLLGRLATCFDFGGPRKRVILSDQEFPTVPFLWDALRRLGAEPVVVAGGDDPEAALEAALDERTLLVCVSHASYRTGALLDLGRLVRAAHGAGAQVIVDAYQSVGTVPVDVEALGVDYLLGGSHKWLCGAVDHGFVYVRPDRLAALQPVATGWMAGSDPFTFDTQRGFAPDARRLAAGTPAVLPVQLSQLGLELVAEAGIETIRRHSLALTGRILHWADAAGIDSPTPRDPGRRGGIVTLRFPGDRAVAAELVRRDFVCSWRGGLRIAPHFYNTADEVERFLEALAAVRRSHA